MHTAHFGLQLPAQGIQRAHGGSHSRQSHTAQGGSHTFSHSFPGQRPHGKSQLRHSTSSHSSHVGSQAKQTKGDSSHCTHRGSQSKQDTSRLGGGPVQQSPTPHVCIGIEIFISSILFLSPCTCMHVHMREALTYTRHAESHSQRTCALAQGILEGTHPSKEWLRQTAQTSKIRDGSHLRNSQCMLV